MNMRIAKATEKEVRDLQQFFEEIEELLEDGIDTYEDYERIIDERFPKLAGGWRRILFGYKTLLKNTCDPSLSYLEWKPEIKALLERQTVWDKLRSLMKRLGKVLTRKGTW